MGVTTTTGGYFPNYDITHKPKRYQNQVASEQSVKLDNGTATVDISVPQSVTIESAITYFKSHADGQNKNLFNRTALWLEEFVNLKQTLAKKKTEALDTILQSAKSEE